ncbi:DUF4040 domain-containing protein [Oscillatoria sp. CS-180]|uniref:DUF4040 domain-containing protein n=1 Tax=Oscillatoria sp. CS-180 TaxID=3021720 RepID=UPI002330524F|nr:DUF4040 domain-containing protein [Oscillatoria sp. CS-180]MDB9528825.1 DUF4040 domain-containing protein [Oscillatoria sp. CS-180]
MSEELYMVAIAALLPLTAGMLVTQVNPYHALVIRGILGAVAALVYALFGAADVALTEALVGTMLSITLYAIAVRSSMSLRLGVLEMTAEGPSSLSQTLLPSLRKTLKQHHMRLEVLTYPSSQALQASLRAKELHGVIAPNDDNPASVSGLHSAASSPLYHLTVRVPRVHSILDAGLPDTVATVEYCQTLPESFPIRQPEDVLLRGRLEG